MFPILNPIQAKASDTANIFLNFLSETQRVQSAGIHDLCFDVINIFRLKKLNFGNINAL